MICHEHRTGQIGTVAAANGNSGKGNVTETGTETGGKTGAAEGTTVTGTGIAGMTGVAVDGRMIGTNASGSGAEPWLSCGFAVAGRVLYMLLGWLRLCH
jgi:hypothetical protein